MQALKRKAKIDKKAEDVSQTKSLTPKPRPGSQENFKKVELLEMFLPNILKNI